MSTQTSSGDLVSDRYAHALYELAGDSNCVNEVLDNLELIQKYIKQNNEFKLLLKSPLITSNDKLTIIEKITSQQNFKIITINFLKVISNNKRFPKLNSIINQFSNINAKKRGDILADVTSAEELTNEQKNGVTSRLKTILGEKLSLTFKVDQTIVGGLIVKVGSKMIDSSLLSKINKLKIAMKGA